MALAAVAYTRGPLTGPHRHDPGGPGKARGGSVQTDTHARQAVRDHSSTADFQVLLWRSDAHDPSARSDELLGLQQCLFMLRADLADALYIHRSDDVPFDDVAIIAAEIAVFGKTLIVEGRRVLDRRPLAASDDLHQLAELGARLRDQAAERVESTGTIYDLEDLDIGTRDSRAQAVRVAHKLRHEFGLPGDVIADVLEEAQFLYRRLPLDRHWNRQAVSRLLRGQPTA